MIMICVPIIIFGIVRYRRTDICICNDAEVDQDSKVEIKFRPVGVEIKPNPVQTEIEVQTKKPPPLIVEPKRQFTFQENEIDNKSMNQANSSENKSVLKTPHRSKEEKKIPKEAQYKTNTNQKTGEE